MPVFINLKTYDLGLLSVLGISLITCNLLCLCNSPYVIFLFDICFYCRKYNCNSNASFDFSLGTYVYLLSIETLPNNVYLIL